VSADLHSGAATAGVAAVAVVSCAELPIGEGRTFAVEGEQVAVFRLRNGSLYAVSAVCPHAGGPIGDGQIDGTVVQCPLHQNAFRLADGVSTTGQPPLRSYPVHVDDAGEVVIEMSTG
jgi:nitrite reductase (NADH) small subunit